MSPNYENACCEITYIIENMDKVYSSRIPEKLREFFKKKQSKYYTVNLTIDKPLEEQVLLMETKAILAMLCRKYLCEENIRKELEEKFKRDLQDEKLKRQSEPPKEISYSFNSFSQSSNKLVQETKVDTVSVLPQVYEKVSWYKRLINSVKRVFKITR